MEENSKSNTIKIFDSLVNKNPEIDTAEKLTKEYFSLVFDKQHKKVLELAKSYFNKKRKDGFNIYQNS